LRQSDANSPRQPSAAAISDFAKRVLAGLDGLDFGPRQRLLRLVVEEVLVTGWQVGSDSASRSTMVRMMNRPVLGPIDRQARTCQAIWVCVRFIMLKGDSYWVKDRDLAKGMIGDRH
jgi:hypothetical protein